MGIDNYLKVIKEGVFGRDVRQAIHDGIEQAYDDATAEGNANMEVAKARGEFDNLSKRFENVTEQLGDVKESLTSPFNFKGTLQTTSQLPSTALINDTYYIESEMVRYSYNGQSWFKSSMSETQYLDSLVKLKNFTIYIKV